MDPKIRQYANHLYERKASALAATCRQAIQTEMADSKRHGQYFSGSAYSALLKIHADFTGRDLAARLASFSEAFEEAGAQPFDEDFDEIWRIVQEAEERQLQTRVRILRDYLRRYQQALDPAGGLSSAIAHEHDRVLHDWKVWRGRVNLGPKPLPTNNPGIYIGGPIHASQLQIGTRGSSQASATAASQPMDADDTAASSVESNDAEWLKTWWGKIVIGVATAVLAALLIYEGKELWQGLRGPVQTPSHFQAPAPSGKVQSQRPSAIPSTAGHEVAIPGIWTALGVNDRPVFYEFRRNGTVLVRDSLDDSHPKALPNVLWSTSGDRLFIQAFERGKAVDMYHGTLFLDLGEIVGGSMSLSSRFPHSSFTKIK